ncbi:hypothetical protein [Streptomyces sp. NPDC048266]|uniref:hypothetical protein n=1 Tax=Streptomyces sp. NPDC048266 TaxID=3155787 RepID=UPI00340FD654
MSVDHVGDRLAPLGDGEVLVRGGGQLVPTHAVDVPGRLVGAHVDALTKVVMTYRPKASLSLGSWPEAGPKRRHHSIQYAVRASIPSRDPLGQAGFDGLLQQALVLRVAGVRCGCGLGEPILQLGAERARVELGLVAKLPESDLDQGGRQPLLHLPPSQ